LPNLQNFIIVISRLRHYESFLSHAFFLIKSKKQQLNINRFKNNIDSLDKNIWTVIMNIFTFDIETVPDTEAGNLLYQLNNSLQDADIAEQMFAKRIEETGSNFLPLHLHKICAISAVLKTPHSLKVWSLGDIDSQEQEIVERFFTGIEKYTPILVSWNGGKFDLPVLHYRSLLYGICAPRYWELGERDGNFRYNNYINRYHYRHMDVMDVIASYNPSAYAKLDQISLMLGLPGKMGMSGDKVWDHYLKNDLKSIRDYCETDVINTYLIYQRFCLVQGKITKTQYQTICDEMRELLRSSNEAHLLEFEKQWNDRITT